MRRHCVVPPAKLHLSNGEERGTEMRLLIITGAMVLACICGMTASAFAQSRSEVVTIPAPSLAKNLVGTSDAKLATVYLPPSYDSASARRYPTIYLLHGVFDSHDAWLGRLGMKVGLDRLIESGDIPEVIVVMPNGGNNYGGGYYRNSPVTGNWRDFITKDLISYVDENYRTLARSGGRSLGGWSMGGYGAIHIAMEEPGLFSNVYSVGPCCLASIEDLGFGNDAWGRAFQFDDPSDIPASLQKRDFYPVIVTGLLSAFATEVADTPLHIRFPLRFERGQFIPDGEAYDTYMAQFPLSRIAERRAALTQLRALGLEYGINEQYPHIPVATRAFSQRLGELRIPHNLDIYVGDHRDRVPERLESVILPFLAATLDGPEG
jgi:S-formylglutathione hydrolase FrmB